MTNHITSVNFIDLILICRYAPSNIFAVYGALMDFPMHFPPVATVPAAVRLQQAEVVLVFLL